MSPDLEGQHTVVSMDEHDGRPRSKWARLQSLVEVSLMGTIWMPVRTCSARRCARSTHVLTLSPSLRKPLSSTTEARSGQTPGINHCIVCSKTFSLLARAQTNKQASTAFPASGECFKGNDSFAWAMKSRITVKIRSVQ